MAIKISRSNTNSEPLNVKYDTAFLGRVSGDT